MPLDATPPRGSDDDDERAMEMVRRANRILDVVEGMPPSDAMTSISTALMIHIRNTLPRLLSPIVVAGAISELIIHNWSRLPVPWPRNVK